MKIVLAADPFALSLKNAILAHLREKGHIVSDVGASETNPVPYFDSAPVACRAILDGHAERGILICGTGMGMAMIANRFPGIRGGVVESVFAAKMCRAINDANVLCLGGMIWGDWMANEAVDTFLTTGLADGLEAFADFLRDAATKVEQIRP